MKPWILILASFLAGCITSAAMSSDPVYRTAEVRLDERAYQHAQREAQLQASRSRVGHWLGIAPGCRFAGVGSSTSTSRPNHCSTGRYRLVARAWAIGRDGKVYWSAQYR